MTEKRFITIESGIDFGVIDNTIDERIFDIDITAKLNELADENEQLKQSLKNKMESDAYWEQKAIERVNKLEKENEQLKNRVDELEDDNMKYTLSTDKLEGYTKRFMPTKCINEFRDCKTNRYYWLDNEDNFTGALELLNLLDCENEQLKYTLSAYIVDLNNCKGKCSTLEIENEQLKESLKNKMESDAYWEVKAKERVQELEQENKQLKEEIEKYKQSNREAIKIVERYNRLLKELGYDK